MLGIRTEETTLDLEIKSQQILVSVNAQVLCRALVSRICVMSFTASPPLSTGLDGISSPRAFDSRGGVSGSDSGHGRPF